VFVDYLKAILRNYSTRIEEINENLRIIGAVVEIRTTNLPIVGKSFITESLVLE
jgi:hypothetical protein